MLEKSAKKEIAIRDRKQNHKQLHGIEKNKLKGINSESLRRKQKHHAVK